MDTPAAYAAPVESPASNEPTASPTSPRDEAMSPAHIAEALAIARKALEQIHPGYTRYTSQATLDALWADIEAKLLAKPTRGVM